ncbi:hypothetical protein ACGF3J_31720 [Streptomyces sp. NPDC048171]
MQALQQFEWTAVGVWPRPHEVLLAKLRGANVVGFSRAVVDGPVSGH